MTKLEKRFWDKVIKSPSCWEWSAAKTGSGYGEFWIGDKMEGAHRVSYTIECGQIPKGLHVCHTCDNPICVNPNHLFLGSVSDNMQDAVRKGRKRNINPVQGSRHGRSKLTEFKVKAIRKDIRLHRVIANEYGVTRRTISDIKQNKTWNHI